MRTLYNNLFLVCFLVVGAFLLFSCDSDAKGTEALITAVTAKADSAELTITTVPAKLADIELTDGAEGVKAGAFEVKVPTSTDPAKVVLDFTLSSGATVSPAPAAADFDATGATKSYTVTAEDGEAKTAYVVTLTVL